MPDSKNLAAVEQLRQLHSAAEGEYRCRAAVQLGLVIADLVAELSGDDRRLPELAEEGLLRLDEGTVGADTAIPTAAVARARDVLSSRVRPPATPAEFSISPEILGLMGKLDPSTMHSAFEAVRLMMPDVPEGHPNRVMMRTLLRLFDADLVDGFRSGRWKPEFDEALAGFDQLEADVVEAGGSLDPQVLSILHEVSARLHEVRGTSATDRPHVSERSVEPERPEPRPVSDEPHWPSGPELQRFLRAWPALNLITSMLPADERSRVPMQTLMKANELVTALRTRAWTAEHDEALADLRGLVGGEGMAPDEAVWARATVVLVHAARCQTAADSPNPADWPDSAELTEVVTELEDVLGPLGEAGPWAQLMAGPLRAQAANLLLRLAEHAGRDTVAELLSRAREHLAEVPPELVPEARRAAADLARVVRGMDGDGAEGGTESAVGGDHRDSSGTGPLDIARLTAEVDRARTGSPADLMAAITKLRTVSGSLQAGDPQRATILTWLADLLGRLPASALSPDDLVDAIEAAIEAVRAAPRNGMRNAAAVLTQLLGRMVAEDQRVGPFEPAEAVLAAQLANIDPDDTTLRLLLTLGLAGARSLRARATGAEDLRRSARDTFVAVEHLLGEPAPTNEWLGPAWLLLSWAASQATLGGDTESAALAVRMADRVERVLVDHPELTERMSTQFAEPAPLGLGSGGKGVLQALRVMKDMVSVLAGSGPLAEIMRKNRTALRFRAERPSFVPPSAEDTRRLATRGLSQARSALDTGGPGDMESLRTACADLRVALTGGLDDNSLRQQVNGTLGRCLATLFQLGDNDEQTLVDAIQHLDSALVGSEHTVPTVERAELMDVLARCYREAGGRFLDTGAQAAERTVRAALRELARCVLVVDDTDRALEIATRANEIVARTLSWCLADQNLATAAEIAEAGRSLVLASVVLAGRMESVLRGTGEEEAADAWRRNDAEGKLASLNTLWQTRFGASLLNTPTAQEITAMLAVGSAVDGLVYLVPPVADGSPAYAIVCRAGLDGQFEMVALPEMRIGAGTPLGDYLAAFGTALKGHDPARRHADGFRGTSPGRAWAQALDSVGAWTYEHLVEPLVRHARGWSLDHTPHLMLVPLGEFAAIPYAAAWTEDRDMSGGRRYAVHDLVLSHAVSARLFGEVARRPHQPLTERVVLVPDPTGQFPYARRTVQTLAARLYPAAEVYDRRTSSVERILAALPGRDRQGASLVHLSTHATTEPTARLWAGDGWLPLNEILDQARGRAPDSPGGLIITNACLTDSTSSHYDESVTLATALLTAGATGVVGTRWPIDDDTTAVLTYHLHHRLGLGSPPAEALRLAQLDMLDPDGRSRPGLHPHLAAVAADRLAHPASWAAFTYHGT